MGEPVQTSNSPSKDVREGPQTLDVAFGNPGGSARRVSHAAGTRPKVVSDYVGRLSEEHKMLVALKAQLYGGTWTPMLEDLRHRLAGKPYIFKLVHRIQDDIRRIE